MAPLARRLRTLSIAFVVAGVLLVVIGDGPTRCDGDDCSAATWRPYGVLLLVLAALMALAQMRINRRSEADTPDR